MAELTIAFDNGAVSLSGIKLEFIMLIHLFQFFNVSLTSKVEIEDFLSQ